MTRKICCYGLTRIQVYLLPTTIEPIERPFFGQVTVGKGVADLVLLPVEQYRRDGRVFRGLRKGTQSFLRAITIETLHTSHRVASYISRTLDDIVTQPGAHASLRGLEYYDEQPTGVIDSLEHAYDALAKEVQVWRFIVCRVTACMLPCVFQDAFLRLVALCPERKTREGCTVCRQSRDRLRCLNHDKYSVKKPIYMFIFHYRSPLFFPCVRVRRLLPTWIFASSRDIPC